MTPGWRWVPARSPDRTWAHRSAPGPSPRCELAVTATERAVQTLGGEGHSREQPVERMCRDARIRTALPDNPDTP
ncbi:acyl-CoA dehydrogenase family protein [Streptomyces microflavus]